VRPPKVRSFVTLDDPATVHACLWDPRTFLTGYRKPLVIDEFQLGGVLPSPSGDSPGQRS